jgi:hypothetical protein
MAIRQAQIVRTSGVRQPMARVVDCATEDMIGPGLGLHTSSVRSVIAAAQHSIFAAMRQPQ